MPKKSQRNPDMPKPQPSAAEVRYGTGQQVMPPMLHQMSTTSQDVARAGFSEALSNVRTREENFAKTPNKKGNLPKSAMAPGQIARLKDTEVSIETAGANLAGHWDRMMASSNRPDPAWYFGHNRRLTQTAEMYDMDPNTVIDASGAMSPQNDPDSEYRAVSSMADAVRNRRQIRAVNDVHSIVSDEQRKKGVLPRLIMRAGERRTLASMTPDDMAHATAAGNVKNVSHTEDFDLPGFRNAGTNRRQGFRTLNEPGYNAVDEMEAAKVHLYTGVTKASQPDTPLHHEYEMRFGDQDVARNVRLGRKADKRAGITGSEAIRGVPDRVDLYGLMKGGDDPTDPAFHHPILGTRGMAVPDTWMGGLLSGQEMHDLPDSSSPGKALGSQTASHTAGIAGSTFMAPAEAKEAGGKAMSGGAMFGMAALAAIQHAAVVGREKESQTNIPPVMMQEMPWTHVRGEVAESTQDLINAGDVGGNKGTAGSRVARLTSGTLAGEKEFRGSDAPSNVTRLERPGMFSRGYDNPMDTDSVTLVPRASGSPVSAAPLSQPSRALSTFHEQAAGEAPDELSKRRAILNAQQTYQVGRSNGGSAWADESGTKMSKRGR